jgi:hypothetical protein
MAGLMIAAELTQRRFIQLKKNVAQFLDFGITGGEAPSINQAQRPDQAISVLVVDFAVVVAVAIVETCLAHAAALLMPRATASSHRDQLATLRRNNTPSRSEALGWRSTQYRKSALWPKVSYVASV